MVSGSCAPRVRLIDGVSSVDRPVAEGLHWRAADDAPEQGVNEVLGGPRPQALCNVRRQKAWAIPGETRLVPRGDERRGEGEPDGASEADELPASGAVTVSRIHKG